MVECDLAKVEVAGSNPVSRSIWLCEPSFGGLVAFLRAYLRRTQKPPGAETMIEIKAARPSRPVAPSAFQDLSRPHFGPMDFLLRPSYCKHRARYPSGKGEVCKTFMRRFDSDPRLQPLELLPLAADPNCMKIQSPAHGPSFGR